MNHGDEYGLHGMMMSVKAKIQSNEEKIKSHEALLARQETKNAPVLNENDNSRTMMGYHSKVQAKRVPAQIKIDLAKSKIALAEARFELHTAEMELALGIDSQQIFDENLNVFSDC